MIKLFKRWFVKDKSICPDGHTSLSECVDAFRDSYEFDFQEELSKEKVNNNELDSVKLCGQVEQQYDRKIVTDYHGVATANISTACASRLYPATCEVYETYSDYDESASTWQIVKELKKGGG
jgi:hypothetical protein